MRKYLYYVIVATLLFSALILFYTTQSSAKSDLVIVVNAGSSGSRGHVYAVDKQNKTIDEIGTPVIVQPGISSFANDHKKLIDYIDSLITSIDKDILQANNITDTQEIPLYFMATAGMRLLESNNANAIYKLITERLQKKFTVKYSGTISGRAEGLYDWLTVNYLSNKLQDMNNTVTALDMGGASTQIAYIDNNIKNPQYNYNLQLGDIKQNIFIYSFLGLGYNKAIDELLKSPECSSHLSADKCIVKAKQLVDQYKVKTIAGDLSKKNIIAFDHIYKLYVYFNIVNSAKPILALDNVIYNKCNIPQSDAKLAKQCVGAIYLSTLLQYGYNLDRLIDNSQLQLKNEINEVNLDWSLGMALFHSLSGADKPEL
jgi:Icc-related predicted phosphoesterase